MKRFKNILLYAGMEQNDAAVSRSIKLAIENHASLTLMDVVKPIPRALGMLTDFGDSEELQQLIVRDHREQLLSIASEYLDTGVPIDVLVTVGDPATEIVRQVLRYKHDLVVKSVNSHLAAARIFGSIARSLLRICPCPLWLLKPEIHGEFDRVLAAVDLEAADEVHVSLNRNIMELAIAIAERENAELHLVSAWNLWMENSLRRRSGDDEVDTAIKAHEHNVRQTLDKLLGDYSGRIEDHRIHLVRGNAAAAVQWIADQMEADLVVMGTVCRTGLAGFLIGNTAEMVLNELTCSVLTLKPDGFLSPVEMADPTTNETDERTSAR